MNDGDGEVRLYGGSDNDTISAGAGNDPAAGNKGDDVASGGYGNDTRYGGWGADRLYGGPGNDILHALAPDAQPDVLACGAGNDAAFVLRSERATTTIRGCEKVFVEINPTPDSSRRRTRTPTQRPTANAEAATRSPLGHHPLTDRRPSATPGAAIVPAEWRRS